MRIGYAHEAMRRYCSQGSRAGVNATRLGAGAPVKELRCYARGARSRAQLALDVVERGVADILAVHHVDDVLADVFGVIADALERAHDPHDIERATNGAR